VTAILIIAGIALTGLLLWLGTRFYKYVERTYDYSILTLEQVIVFVLLMAGWIAGGILLYKYHLSDAMYLDTVVTLSAALLLTCYQFVRIASKTRWYIALGVMTIQLFIFVGIVVLAGLAGERRRGYDDDHY